jgi:hypothetical protein
MMGNKPLDNYRFLSSMTLFSGSGKSVKIGASGDIVQYPAAKNTTRETKLLESVGLGYTSIQNQREVYRTISNKGVITRTFNDNSSMIYFPSGLIEFGLKGHTHHRILANGKHKFIDWKAKEAKLVEQIETTQASDVETGISYISRADGFRRFDYPDGSKLVIFNDGTHLHTDAKKEVFTITHASYDKVVITYDFFRARNPGVIGLGSAFASKGKDNLMERSFTGRISEVTLESGITLLTYK